MVSFDSDFAPYDGASVAIHFPIVLYSVPKGQACRWLLTGTGKRTSLISGRFGAFSSDYWPENDKLVPGGVLDYSGVHFRFSKIYYPTKPPQPFKSLAELTYGFYPSFHFKVKFCVPEQLDLDTFKSYLFSLIARSKMGTYALKGIKKAIDVPKIFFELGYTTENTRTSTGHVVKTAMQPNHIETIENVV